MMEFVKSVLDGSDEMMAEGVTYRQRENIEIEAEKVINEQLASGQINKIGIVARYWTLVFEMIEKAVKKNNG